MTHVCYACFNLTCYHALSRHTPSLRSMVVLSGARLSNARATHAKRARTSGGVICPTPYPQDSTVSKTFERNVRETKMTSHQGRGLPSLNLHEEKVRDSLQSNEEDLLHCCIINMEKMSTKTK